MTDFDGAKIALILDGQILAMHRSNWPWLRDRNKWDVPGGAREGKETPEECAIREVKEELGIILDPKSIIWKQMYESLYRPGRQVYFMVANITADQVSSVQFGREGQGWKMMPTGAFLSDENVIEVYKLRLGDYLATKKEAEAS